MQDFGERLYQGFNKASFDVCVSSFYAPKCPFKNQMDDYLTD